MATSEAMQSTVASLLKGIDRYNPGNLGTLETYVDAQTKENTYDLEANAVVLKLYQFNPNKFQTSVTVQVLLKALTNLPNTDFSLCKGFIEEQRLKEPPISHILDLAELLETCRFTEFWSELRAQPGIIDGFVGFEDSIKKFVCHVVGITYQTIEAEALRGYLGDVGDQELAAWVSKYGWTRCSSRHSLIYVANQEDRIKTKKITEKIAFDSVAGVMKRSQV